MTEELLTPEEAAGILKMRPETVREWLRTGRLKGLKAGPRMWRIKESDLVEFLKGPSSLYRSTGHE